MNKLLTYFSSKREEKEIGQSIYLYYHNSLRKVIGKKVLHAREMAECDNLPVDIPAPTPQALISLMNEPNKTQEILKLFENNDRIVFAYLYEYEYSRIRSYIFSKSGKYHGAYDIFQETITTIYEMSIKQTLKIKTTFSAYFFTIARNLWIKEIKNRNKEKIFYEEVIEDTDIDESLKTEDFPDQYEIICNLMDQLGNPCKELLEFYYFRKYDWKKIANVLGYSSSGSARNQKYKCLQRIKEQVKRSQLQ